MRAKTETSGKSFRHSLNTHLPCRRKKNSENESCCPRWTTSGCCSARWRCALGPSAAPAAPGAWNEKKKISARFINVVHFFNDEWNDAGISQPLDESVLSQYTGWPRWSETRFCWLHCCSTVCPILLGQLLLDISGIADGQDCGTSRIQSTKRSLWPPYVQVKAKCSSNKGDRGGLGASRIDKNWKLRGRKNSDEGHVSFRQAAQHESESRRRPRERLTDWPSIVDCNRSTKRHKASCCSLARYQGAESDADVS